jgi:hypothetical protein
MLVIRKSDCDLSIFNNGVFIMHLVNDSVSGGTIGLEDPIKHFTHALRMFGID